MGAELQVKPETMRLHNDMLVIDGLSLFYVLDNEYSARLRKGGVDATIVTFAAVEDWERTLNLIEVGLQKIEASSQLMLATCVADITAAKAADKTAVIMGFQGADMVGDQLWRIGLLYRLGLRCIQLTYTFAGLYGDGCGEHRDAGLSFLGREFIAAVNDHRMLLDLSHCGHRTTAEAIDLSARPVFTHANAYSVTPNDRNKKDESLVALARKGGIVGATCLVRAVKEQDADLDALLDHIQYLCGTMGVDNVGIGLDFTEGLKEAGGNPGRQTVENRTRRPDIFGTVEDFFNQKYPRNIDSITLLPNLTQGLIDRGFNSDDVCGILGKNWLQHLRTMIG